MTLSVTHITYFSCYLYADVILLFYHLRLRTAFVAFFPDSYIVHQFWHSYFMSHKGFINSFIVT